MASDNGQAITDFWQWFSEHSAELAARTIPDSLIDELESRLFAIHRLDWEIGPGRNAPNLFALSPRGERDLLGLTQRIIEEAPALRDWEFHAAKPPRDWDLVFSLTVDGKPVEIDGKLWEFVAHKFKDGTYDLLLKPNGVNGLDDDYVRWAATIIADGELGEERRMNLVGNIETVPSWDEDAARSARKLEVGVLPKVIA